MPNVVVFLATRLFKIFSVRMLTVSILLCLYKEIISSIQSATPYLSVIVQRRIAVMGMDTHLSCLIFLFGEKVSIENRCILFFSKSIMPHKIRIFRVWFNRQNLLRTFEHSKEVAKNNYPLNKQCHKYISLFHEQTFSICFIIYCV